MTKLSDKERERAKKNNLSPEKYARLRAEAKAPYKGIRQFFYLAFAASGLIGAFIFLSKLFAATDVRTDLPNLALQVGVIVLMVFLFRWEQKQ